MSERSTIDRFVVVVDWEDIVQVTEAPYTVESIQKHRSHRSNSGVAVYVDSEIFVVSEDLDHTIENNCGYHIIPRGAIKEVRRKGKKLNWNQVRSIVTEFRKSRSL